MSLLLINLRWGMERPGCPACWSVLRRERHYLESLIHEEVNDPHVRIELLRTFGFCSHHTWLLTGVEQAIYGDKSGSSILLEAFIDEWRRRLVAHLEPVSMRRRASRTEIMPGAHCRVCKSVSQGTAIELIEFVRALDSGDEDLSRAYDESAGLCLIHIATLLDAVPVESPARQRIVDRAQRTAEMLLTQLHEYDRLRAWDKRDLPRGLEQSAWQRAAAFFGGVADSLAVRDPQLWHPERQSKHAPAEDDLPTKMT